MNKLISILVFLLLFLTIFGQSQEELFAEKLVSAALSLTEQEVVYDPGYYAIAYPNGDIPAGRGVCTDVVIRAYRYLAIDLQKEVHEDMLAHFEIYPDIWGLKQPDANIDHRRVPNLMKYFERHGSEIPITNSPADYHAGDVVCWNLGGAITHIGILVQSRSTDGLRPMVVHNIGRGQVLEDCLFDYRIIGHYIYQGK